MFGMRDALSRSEGSGDGDLDGRNMECLCCFGKFTADLLEIANAGSGNGDGDLGFCNGFARNAALSNGIQGTPHKGVSCF